MAQPLVKEELREIAESLPEDATWEDVQYLVYLRHAIAEGRRSAREEPTLTTEEIFAKYRLDND